MDPARFDRLQELFHAAADLAPAERDLFLAQVDPDLRSDLSALLAHDKQDSSVLDHGLAAAARQAVTALPPAFEHQLFGPYRLERLLGEGGMGLVFLGRRDDLASTAAIKVLRDAWLSPSRRDRFLAEQRTLAALHHPYIAALYDADTLPDGTPWFAMEYIEGLPVTEYCDSRSASLADRLRLFRSICEAVEHAHSHAIIHRDLKPSNILVTADGQAKLLDFGIAKQLDASAEDQTRTGFRLMTPAYAAPEQLRGEPTGVYTDIYSLGVILDELLSSARPNLTASSRADLEVLCQTARHPEPARRYRSVEALIRDLDHYLRAEPLEARPDSLRYRASKFLRRHRARVIAAAALFIGLASLVAFYTIRLAAARNEAVAEAARSQRTMRFVLNLFEGGDHYAGPATDLRVVTLLDRGVDQARSLSRDPSAQAELYGTLGNVYHQLGQLEKADTLLHSALDQRRSLYGPDDPAYSRGLLDLALLRADQARFDDAERLARQGLELLRRRYPAGHPAIAGALESLGKVLEERGSYEPAVKILEEAVAIRTRSPDRAPADLAASLAGLANVHFYAGHYAQSESLNQRVLAMHRQIYGPQHPSVAEDLINLGAIQQDTGHYVEAEKLHRQALEITRSFYGEDHPRTAANLTLIGRALVFQDRLDDAVGLLERALVIRERVYGPRHPQVASTLNELGNLGIRRKTFPAAEIHFRRVIAIYRESYKNKHYLISIGLSNLASVFMAQQQFTRAEPLLREAMAMYAQTLAPTHLNVGIGRIKLGRTLLRQKRYLEAQAETRAGFDILSKQASPAVSWLNNARQDLAEEEAALRPPRR